ncbi:prolyl oligopeptidase family serine peptidase [Winogradskyella sp. R77965]|uniref:carboxylesterase family protein n=1 Tax=Winogradskyella sp. R77965 TaxID=3093872 RepID=UPI0037DDAF0A
MNPKLKNLILVPTSLFFLMAFQTKDIQKTLDDINARFKNVDVSVINWPEDLQKNLGKLKASAFVALPRNQSAKKIPLLITLHGGGGKTWSLAEQLSRSAKVKGLSLVELAGKELMLVEPNSFDKWDPKTLDIMLDYILEEYPQVDSNRIYVMGHSMGGSGTWAWILNSPERFAAASASGFRSVKDTDDISKLTNMPMWGMVGADDVKNVEPVKKMVNLLKSAGNTNVRYTAFEGANHAQGNAKVFSSVECIDWMLTFSLEDKN